MRIIMIGAVVFLAAWFTVLRPKPAAIEPTTATTATTTTTTPAEPQTRLGKAVQSAKNAAKQAAGTTATPTAGTKPGVAATPAPAGKPEAAPIAIPAEALAKLPDDVARALQAHHVLVLAVIADGSQSWRPIADDDRAVRSALRHVNRYDGQVLVKQVPVSKLSGYGSLVNDLGVLQSPSVVVIDGNLKGNVLTGYVDRGAINQSIADARRSSLSPNIKDAYLRKANELCGNYETRWSRWSRPTTRGKQAETAALARGLALVKTYRHAIVRTAAPAKWRGLKAQWVRVMTVRENAMGALVKSHKSGQTTDLVAAYAAFDPSDVRKLDSRFDAAGLTDCSILRSS
jgi:hypothetical protein